MELSDNNGNFHPRKLTVFRCFSGGTVEMNTARERALTHIVSYYYLYHRRCRNAYCKRSEPLCRACRTVYCPREGIDTRLLRTFLHPPRSCRNEYCPRKGIDTCYVPCNQAPIFCVEMNTARGRALTRFS